MAEHSEGVAKGVDPNASRNTTNEHSLPPAAVDPRLVHRVLLTDPVDFSSLTMSGHPRMTTTSTYTEFCDSLKESRTPSGSSSHPVNMQTLVRGAARDVLCQRVQTSQSLEPAKEALLEVHNKVRQLIPSRKDLHSILKDEDVRQAEYLSQLQSATLVIAQALLQLESPARSASTLEFIQSQPKSTPTPTSSIDELNPESISGLITPLFYLLWKVELCSADMQDFYLANVWAPQIHQNGKKLEHEHFQTQYGKFADSTTAPKTRQWIQSLLDRQQHLGQVGPPAPGDTTTTTSRESRAWRQDLLAKGWIEDIMFRSPELPVLALPEILALDADNLADIRQVTRLAMAGSALALHACTTAGQSTDALNQQVQDRSLEVQRVALVQAMNEQHQRNSPADYERVVGDAVVALALQWNAGMDDAAVSSLRNRVTVTLRGEDPVLKLLNGRMKECFSQLVVKLRPAAAAANANVVPAALKSGRPMVVDGAAAPVERRSDSFLKEAHELFCSRGLAFYASDLAQAAKQAAQVIELAWKLYGEVFLDRIILDADVQSEL
jgi:hypothetical protein